MQFPETSSPLLSEMSGILSNNRVLVGTLNSDLNCLRHYIFVSRGAKRRTVRKLDLPGYARSQLYIVAYFN